MKGAIRKLVQPFLWKAYRLYLNKKRWYQYQDLSVCVYPSVFHPGLLISTKVMLSYIQSLPVKNKKVLELGAGSGLIALWSAKAGAEVTASDLNPAALQSIDESCKKNNLSIHTVKSDLFDELEPEIFDYIFINPPFYPGQTTDDRSLAFFCGENFEYFFKLFDQVKSIDFEKTTILIILTDDCDWSQISNIAEKKGMTLMIQHKEIKWKEVHTIYKVESL